MNSRILIAEDNPAVRNALRQLLESAGHWEVVEAENGEEAIGKAQELKPDLIILDLVMPVMDGLKAARQISKLLPDVPVVMHTMHWSPQMELEAQKVGVRKVVPKSESAVLISTVQQFLPRDQALSIGAKKEVSADIPVPEVPAIAPILDSSKDVVTEPADAPAAGSAGDSPKNSLPN